MSHTPEETEIESFKCFLDSFEMMKEELDNPFPSKERLKQIVKMMEDELA